jgi:hypothetical protein
MGDYAIIQGQTTLQFMFAFLLVAISSYAYMTWVVGAHRINASDQKPVLARLRMSRSIRMSVRISPSALPQRAQAATDKTSFIAEWLAPLIVWLVVAGTGLAVVIFLLGEN